MWHYVGLINTMFYELIALGQSPLLSVLCVVNRIKYKPAHFSLSTDNIRLKSNYDSWKSTCDLHLIVKSLLKLFQKDLCGLYNIHEKSIGYLFKGYVLTNDSDLNDISNTLKAIDGAMRELKGTADPQQIMELMQRHDQQAEQIKSQEKQLTDQKQQITELIQCRDQQAEQIKSQEKQLTELKQQLAIQRQQPETQEEPLADMNSPSALQNQSLEEKELPWGRKQKSAGLTPQTAQVEEPDPLSCLPFSERLKVFASNRQKVDEDILQEIQHLRNDLQSELQEIAKIREGLEFETLQESISQVLAIHGLLWDILESHPMKDVNSGYYNLIDCCDDLRKNIVEALAMLGVTYINDAGIPYVPSMHRTQPGVLPTRNAMITKVLRPGFSYRSKTLEKAVVELQ